MPGLLKSVERKLRVVDEPSSCRVDDDKIILVSETEQERGLSRKNMRDSRVHSKGLSPRQGMLSL